MHVGQHMDIWHQCYWGHTNYRKRLLERLQRTTRSLNSSSLLHDDRNCMLPCCRLHEWLSVGLLGVQLTRLCDQVWMLLRWRELVVDHISIIAGALVCPTAWLATIECSTQTRSLYDRQVPLEEPTTEWSLHASRWLCHENPLWSCAVLCGSLRCLVVPVSLISVSESLVFMLHVHRWCHHICS